MMSKLAHVFTLFFAVLPVPSCCYIDPARTPMLASARSARQCAIQADFLKGRTLPSVTSSASRQAERMDDDRSNVFWLQKTLG